MDAQILCWYVTGAACRSAALLNLGMASEQSLGDGPPRITIVRKQGRRMLENTDEVAHHLQSRFSGQAVVKVLDANENVTIKEQVRRQPDASTATQMPGDIALPAFACTNGSRPLLVDKFIC